MLNAASVVNWALYPLVFGLEQGGMPTRGSHNRAVRKEWKDKTERGIKEGLLFLHY